MLIGLAGQKGGSGKTTISCCLADELYRRGNSVLLLDCDPQGSSSTWSNVRPDDVEGPTVTSAPELLGEDWKDTRDQLAPLLEQYDHIVIDPPPQNETPQRSLLANVDLAIVPCGPSHVDLWSMAETLELVTGYLEARPSLRGKILLNRADARTKLSQQAEQTLREVEIPVFDITLSYYVDYRETLGSGVGVTRYSSGSKAAREIRQFVDEVLAR